MTRVGVFICHCGSNIAGTVDVLQVVEAAKTMPNVVYAVDDKYMCSETGQGMIKQAIIDHNLERVVIGSCTPRQHEPTFRKMMESTALNPYLLEIANLREQCSWVHTNKDKATVKAIDLVRMAVAKASRDFELYSSFIPVTKRALVVGGGIAGMQAALDIGDAGYPVTLVERGPSIGGKMVMLDKTFPTMDCSACICMPKMVDVSTHPNITMMTYSEVDKVDGYIGNFDITIKKKAKYIDYTKCTGCAACTTKCPSKKIPNEFELGMTNRTAIYKAFPQAVPAKVVIDAEHCRYIQTGKCGVCLKTCPVPGAINFDDKDEFVTDRYGAIVMATGYELIDWASIYTEYGGGKYPNVISGLQFERIVNAGGPTGGHIVLPEDVSKPEEERREPKTVVIIKCVGSRESSRGKSYCSRACCMYTAKHAHQILDKIPDSTVYVFYMDVRTAGKAYEEFYNRTLEDGAIYVRGRISKIYQEGDKLICKGENTLISKNVSIAADMVVLETAMVAPKGLREVANVVSVTPDYDGWLNEAHPKLRPVETFTGGVYLAGTAQGPKDIPDSVAQASAAAAKVCGLFSNDEMLTNPMIACNNPEKCAGCELCVKCCPFKAITMVDYPCWDQGKKVTRSVASVNNGLCQGCGCCVVNCRSNALELLGFTNNQILEEVDALCL